MPQTPSSPFPAAAPARAAARAAAPAATACPTELPTANAHPAANTLPTANARPAADHAHLRARGVTHAPGGKPLLTDVDVTVSASTKLAVVGENGSGKTTLLRILTGRLDPYAGSIEQAGTLAIADQELPAYTDMTVGHLADEAIAPARAALDSLDRAAAGMADATRGADDAYSRALELCILLDAWDAERQVDVALEALGAVTDRSRLLTQLSAGQRYRVRLACVLGARTELLVLDEPTNHLDAAGLEFLTAHLASRAGGVLLVSHDAALLADVADEFLDLDPSSDGRPRLYGGGWDGWRSGRAREREAWQKAYDDQQEEHRRLLEAVDQARSRLSTGWRPDKGVDKHKRQSRAPGIVQSLHRREDELRRHALTVPPPPPRLAVPTGRTQPGAPLLTAAEVVVTGRSSHPSTVRLAGGDRLLVTGPNGAGKSTLLAMLSGELTPDEGSVRRHGAVKVERLSQEDTRDSAGTGDAANARDTANAGDAANDRRDHRSPGQLRRRRITRALAAEPDVLLLDEPTNHLAMSLVDDLLTGLEDTSAAVVVATHDRQVLSRLAHWPQLEVGARDESRTVL